MVKGASSFQESDWQKADPRVLGQILAAQNIVFALPDPARIAEFYTQTLISVPGISACRVCLGNISLQLGELEMTACFECELLRQFPDKNNNLLSIERDPQCFFTGQPDTVLVPIQSYQHRFGFFILEIQNTDAFAVYHPFIINLANYVALILENRIQKDLLQKSRDDLERKVEERTHDLLVTNEALSASRSAALANMQEAIEAQKRAEQANADLQHEINERKQTEQALRTSEEELRAFANALPDLAFIMDEDGRHVQFLNAPSHLLYVPASHRLGKYIHEVLPANAANSIMAAVHRTVETGTTQTVEYQLELPNAVIWFEGRTSLMSIKADEKALVVYVARDITDRKEAELKLTRERNLLRTLIDNIPDYIFVKERSGRFIASNLAHSATAQLTPQTVVGKTVKDLFPDDLAQKFHDDDELVMSTGNALIGQEHRIQWGKGREQWVLVTKVPLYNETGDIIGLVGISHDITDRKHMEDALRASEEHLQAVIAATPVIIFELNTTGILTFLQGHGSNGFSEVSTGLVGKSVLALFGNFIPDIEERFKHALAGQETMSIHTIKETVFDVRYTRIWNKQNQVSGIVGVATDITERLKAERLRIELEKEQEVIALKERFIATASHDFRTPLTVIKMSVNMLENYFERLSPEQRMVKLKDIEAQIDQMVELLEDVLTLSKANAGKLDFKPEQVTLRRFCEQIWDNFHRLAEKTHTIEFSYDLAEDQVVLDPKLVHYVLVNLLSNAVKYSPQDGFVRFEVTCSGDDLIFRISDNGIGIPVQDQPKLFEPFHRAINTRGINGTGLGLSIVKHYVETHGGNITFTSQEGQGTTFSVHIPYIPVLDAVT